MLWEVIRKNQRRSITALIITAVWYVCIYGFIAAVFIGSVFDDLMTKQFDKLFIIGAAIALIVFICCFLYEKSRPYKISGCGIYKINKKKHQQLYNIAEETALAAGLAKVPDVYILDSDILNAYACGISPKQSSIVVSRGLLEILNRDELQGVIAHETGHIVNRDTMYLLCSGILFNISAAVTAWLWAGARRGRKGSGGFALLALVSLIGQGICFILFMFISRKREYLADASAAVYTRYPKGLADALLKIENGASGSIYDDLDEKHANRLVKASFITPLKNGKDSWSSTHPSTENRIKVLLSMTSADYAAYEKEFENLNRKKLLPKSALKNQERIPIKNDVQIDNTAPLTAAACSLNSGIADSRQAGIIRENKAVLSRNIKRHRQTEDFVRDLAGYSIINCTCGTKLKIPPVYKNTVIICPHCGRKQTV